MKRDPHRLTYRVRRIPSTWTVEDVEAALLEGLGTTDNIQIRVRVLATDLSRFNREKCRTAVVSFGLEERPWPPRFSLHGLGVKLDCDTVFDDLTPLSSCDRDEQHNVEYASTCINPHSLSASRDQTTLCEIADDTLCYSGSSTDIV